jgi:membrane fusion protein (multidrug efflux system)
MIFRKRHQYLVATWLAAAALLSSGCKSKMGGPPPGGPVEVAVVTIQPQSLALTTQLPGRTAAYLTAEIRPQVNGIIQSRLFQEGAFVRAGDLLYRIDSAPYEAAYGQAKASLATAEADLATTEANLPSLKSRADRYRELVAIHAIGQQDYDDAAAALAQAHATVKARKASIEASRASMESARINLSYTPIKAPISGRIGKSNITVGALATAYQATPLAVVQQLDPIYVDVVQSNAELLRLRRNMETGRLQRDGSAQRKVKLLLEDGTTYPVTGALQFRDVTVDSTTGAVTLRLVFANPKEVLLPGMFVRAIVEEGVRNGAILVPQQGISRDPKGNPYAWVVGKDNKVERRALDLERAIGDQWLVMSGLAAGDAVIVEGTDRVRAGVPVRAPRRCRSGSTTTRRRWTARSTASRGRSRSTRAPGRRSACSRPSPRSTTSRSATAPASRRRRAGASAGRRAGSWPARTG